MAKIDLYFSNLDDEEKLPLNIFDVLFDIDDLFKLIKYSDDTPLDSSKTITDKEKRQMIDSSVTNNIEAYYYI